MLGLVLGDVAWLQVRRSQVVSTHSKLAEAWALSFGVSTPLDHTIDLTPGPARASQAFD